MGDLQLLKNQADEALHDLDLCELRAEFLQREQFRAWEAQDAGARACQDRLTACAATGRADVAAAEEPAPGLPWWSVPAALALGAGLGAAAAW